MKWEWIDIIDMTDEQIDTSRAKILKDFLLTGETLHLESLEICLVSSTAGLYHVFSFFDGNGKSFKKLHKDTITDPKLEEIARTLSILELKKIFIDTKLIKRENKLISGFNPLDFENCA